MIPVMIRSEELHLSWILRTPPGAFADASFTHICLVSLQFNGGWRRTLTWSSLWTIKLVCREGKDGAANILTSCLQGGWGLRHL